MKIKIIQIVRDGDPDASCYEILFPNGVRLPIDDSCVKKFDKVKPELIYNGVQIGSEEHSVLIYCYQIE